MRYEITVITPRGAIWMTYTRVQPFMEAYRRMTNSLRGCIVTSTIYPVN